MSKVSKNSDKTRSDLNTESEKSKSPEKSPVILLLGDVADTTWRLFLPVTLAAIIGIVADKKLETTPWVMFMSIIIGTTIAIWLLILQLKRIKKS